MLRGAATGACPASSPAAGGDDAEATEHNFANRLYWKVEGTKGNIPASLIEEWLGLGLATVGGPTATTLADLEQGSAIPHLKEQRGSSGEGEGACARRGLGGLPFIELGEGTTAKMLGGGGGVSCPVQRRDDEQCFDGVAGCVLDDEKRGRG